MRSEDEEEAARREEADPGRVADAEELAPVDVGEGLDDFARKPALLRDESVASAAFTTFIASFARSVGLAAGFSRSSSSGRVVMRDKPDRGLAVAFVTSRDVEGTRFCAVDRPKGASFAVVRFVDALASAFTAAVRLVRAAGAATSSEVRSSASCSTDGAGGFARAEATARVLAGAKGGLLEVIKSCSAKEACERV